MVPCRGVPTSNTCVLRVGYWRLELGLPRPKGQGCRRGWVDLERSHLALQDYSGSYYPSSYYVVFGYSITTIVTRVVIFCFLKRLLG